MTWSIIIGQNRSDFLWPGWWFKKESLDFETNKSIWQSTYNSMTYIYISYIFIDEAMFIWNLTQFDVASVWFLVEGSGAPKNGFTNVLGCPRWLGSKVSKWVITPIYIYIISHLYVGYNPFTNHFTNFLGHPSVFVSMAPDSVSL